MASTPKQANQKKFFSTKESAKLLNISLGTVQKMVESGELLAWKTRGGHRRVLIESLNSLLKERSKMVDPEKNQMLRFLGIHRHYQDATCLKGILKNMHCHTKLKTSFSVLTGLMTAVEVNPHIIFLDSRIAVIDKVVFLYFLDQNTLTEKIPVFVDEEFLKIDRNAILLAGHSSESLMPYLIRDNINDFPLEKMVKNKKIIPYNHKYYEADLDVNAVYFENLTHEKYPIMDN